MLVPVVVEVVVEVAVLWVVVLGEEEEVEVWPGSVFISTFGSLVLFRSPRSVPPSGGRVRLSLGHM